MENKMISRQEAKSNGLTRYFTGKPCKNGHVAERCTSNKHCIKCINDRRRDWKRANRDKVSSQNRAWYIANREKVLNKIMSEQVKARKRAWHAANPGRCTARWAKYNAKKLHATPPWLTREHIHLMNWIYHLRKIHERVLGGKWHVDHIVPLQGENVCGLHVPWNLQVIQAEENIRKHNKLMIV